MPWSREQQRRSNVDWLAIVPEGVALRQMAWERLCTVKAMRAAGFTQKDIAAKFGVTPPRAHQLTNQSLHIDFKAASPVEMYQAVNELDDDLKLFPNNYRRRRAAIVMLDALAGD